MPVGKDKILGPNGTGTIGPDGRLTSSARNRFVTEVLSLQTIGNQNGLGLSQINPLLPIPIPPAPGPDLPSAFGNSSLFWFNPEPWAALSAPFILNPDGEYQTLIVNGLYEPLAKMLNISGNTSMGPIFDPTIFLDLSSSRFQNTTIPDLPAILTQLVILGNLSQILPLPGIPAKAILLSEFGIGDPLLTAELVPLIIAPPLPVPPIIEIPVPPIPSTPNPGVANYFLPDFISSIYKLPTSIFPQVIGELTNISIDPLALISTIIKLIINSIFSLLGGQLIAPLTLLSSTIAVLIKNLAGMILCDLVGSLFGTGIIVKIIGNLVGLS
jgi:hypothetical protein